MTHYRAACLDSTRPDSRVARIGLAAGTVACAAALTAVSAQASLTLPGSPIPFTLQPVAVLLAGVLLGARLGALSQILYLAAGVAGASAFAWSPVLLPGAARLFGPTGGFLMAFPAAAFVAGLVSERRAANGAVGTAAAMVAGLVGLYAGGIAWSSLFAPSAGVGLMAGLAAYAAADLVKVALVAPVVPALRRALSGRRS
ncbi:MAG TPA: biotin transporter BioY [Vicinamibacterales bacterium]|nr:biotin transporter BioY [Vicinamibacterales bacterium]